MTSKYFGGRFEIKEKIRLGYCQIKTNYPYVNDQIMETILDFGIPEDNLKRLNLSQDELIKIYNNITMYRSCVKYLKKLKDKMMYDGY